MIKIINSILVVGFSLAVSFLVASLFTGGAESYSFSYLFDAPENAGREGGIFPILLNTLIIWACSMLLSVTLGVLIAIACFEVSFKSKLFFRLLLAGLFMLAGVPSIVFGLMGNELFVVRLGWGYSLLSGIVSISMMMLPLVALSVFLGLKNLDPQLLRSVWSLDIPKHKSYLSVLKPAFSGALLAGVVMASGRILAETAALLFTSGYSDGMPSSVFDSGRTLTVHIYDLIANVTGGEARAYTAASLLMILIFVFNFSFKKVIIGK